MEVKKTHTLNGGINTDLSDEHIQATQYRDSRNIIVNSAKDAQIGLGRNVRSNAKLTYGYTLPSGTNTSIGSVPYDKENAMIEFVHNDSNNHEIRLIQDDVVYLVTRGSYLNFDTDYLINAKVYGDYVVWTDNLNDVRLLNIQGAKDYTSAMLYAPTFDNRLIYDYQEVSQGAIHVNVFYTEGGIIYLTGSFPGGVLPIPNISYTTETYKKLDADVIKLIPSPPMESIIALYGNDTDFNMNNLYGDLYQFTYRYIYKDYRKSVWSDLSNTPFPVGSDYEQQRYSNSLLNNVIDLTFNTGSEDVIEIEIAFKKASSTEAFNIIKKIKKYDEDGYINQLNGQNLLSNIDISWRGFYNNEQYIAQNIDELYKPFDYVPALSRNIEILSDGKVILADNTQGITPIEADVEYSYNTDNRKYQTNPITQTSLLNQVYNSTAENVDYYKLALPTGVSYKAGYIFNYTIEIEINEGGTVRSLLAPTVKSVLLPYNSLLSDADNITNGVDTITASMNELAVSTFVNSAVEVYNQDFNYDINYYTLDPFATDLSKHRPIGAMRGDKFQYTSNLNAAYQGDDSFFILKDFREYSHSTTDVISISVTNVSIESTIIENYQSLKRNSRRGIGMVYFDKEGRSGSLEAVGVIDTPETSGLSTNSTNNWEFPMLTPKIEVNHIPPIEAHYCQFAITQNNYFSDYIQYAVEIGTVTANVSVTMKLNTLITAAVTDNENLYYQAWTFEKGDRVRWIAVKVTADNYEYSEIADGEILSYDAGTEFFTIDNSSDDFSNGGTPIADNDIVEIYRPKRGVSSDYELYFLVGEKYGIGNAGLSTRYHEGDTDQVVGTSAAIMNLTFGDCFVRKRYTTSTLGGTFNLEYVVESDHYSDFYKSDLFDYGRPYNISVDLERKNRPSLIRFGGKIDILGRNNNVGTFDYDDYDELNDSFGSINGLGQIGYTLHVIQEKKFTSYYIGKATAQQSTGGEVSFVTSNVLNNKTVSDFDYGTKHKQSVIQRNTHILLFDVDRGAFTRIAKNGSYEISRYGFTATAKEVADIAKTKTDFNIFGEYDQLNDYYVWSWNWIDGTTRYHGSAMFKDAVEGGIWNGGLDFYSGATTIQCVEGLGRYGEKLVSFMDGDVWVNDTTPASGKEYNNLYGEDKGSYFTIVFNEAPNVNKVLQKINLNNIWLPDEFGDIDVDRSNMKSMILTYKDVENSILLSPKRNILYPNGSEPTTTSLKLNRLNKGEVLRGKTFSITFRTDSNELNIISYVTIASSVSEPID